MKLTTRYTIFTLPKIALNSMCTVEGSCNAKLQFHTERTRNATICQPEIKNNYSNLNSQNEILSEYRITSTFKAPAKKVNSQFSILNSQSSILHSQFSILNSQFSILSSPFSILNSQFSILRYQFSILNSKFSVLNSKFSVLNTILFILLFTNSTFSQSTPVSFTQEDRDRIIRTETRLDEGFKQIDKRFEQIDKRFEQVDNRFEQVNQRIEQTDTYMGWMIALFGGMFATTIIFALWDRRTMIRPFESKVKDIEAQLDLLKTDSTNKSILSSLRELAKTDSKLAEILKTHNLL